jgi:DNA invertase Pin-like site-specific DNA recombinase
VVTPERLPDATGALRTPFPCLFLQILASWCFLSEEITMRTAIGYIRVSSEEQADSGLGLESQRQRIRDYCQMKGLSLVTIFEDAGVSGGKALATRPAGARLLAEMMKCKPVLAVTKFDRLLRLVADAAQTIADFDKKGIELVAIAERFDMTNPHGRAMAQTASVFAELECAIIVNGPKRR